MNTINPTQLDKSEEYWFVDDMKRVYRGGGSYSDARYIRTLFRYGSIPYYIYRDIGFRLVRNK
jgi:formylglycine-generating enzyme required for sulfatase activity